jgi:hypothetical protein
MIDMNGPPIVVNCSKPTRTLLTDFDDVFLDSFVPGRDQRERLSPLFSVVSSCFAFVWAERRK